MGMFYFEKCVEDYSFSGFFQDSSNVLYISWFFFDRKTLYVRKDFSSFTDAIDFHSSIFRKKEAGISVLMFHSTIDPKEVNVAQIRLRN